MQMYGKDSAQPNVHLAYEPVDSLKEPFEAGKQLAIQHIQFDADAVEGDSNSANNN